MSALTIARNSLLAGLVPAAAAIALLAGPAQAQTATHNPPTYSQPTTPADGRVDHNPPAYARPAPTNPAGAACAAVAARPAPCPT